MALAYFTVPISENLEVTPEKYLLARNCVLGRTGWQTYKISELPRDTLEKLGVDVSNPSATIEIYRPAEEVFHSDTLASGNGKPVTDGHPKPENSDDGFVSPEYWTKLARGHISDLHQGTEPLEDGEWPILGDLLVTAEPLLSSVLDKEKRELSLGYDYTLHRKGDRIEQHDIIINHLAVVDKGRAGPEARINDGAPVEVLPPATEEITPPLLNETRTKEKRPVKNPILHLLGLGIIAKSKAADADPEEVAQAAMEIGKHAEPKSEDRHHADDKHTDDKHADDKFKKAHDAFQRCMDGKGTDADLEEVKKWVNEEKKEPAHESDDAVSTEELDKVLAADKPADDAHADDAEEEVCEECGKPEDDCECEDEGDAHADDDIGQVTEKSGEERVVAADRHRAADGAAAVLKTLRPVIARTKDEKVKKAFNAALRSVTTSSVARSSDGRGQRDFAARARSRDAAPKKKDKAADGAVTKSRDEQLQEYYDNARKGNK